MFAPQKGQRGWWQRMTCERKALLSDRQFKWAGQWDEVLSTADSKL